MSKGIDCIQCNALVDLTGHPVLCHVCPMGHVLCEECNDIARYYCFYCGGKTERKIPSKEIIELYKVHPDHFMKKILNSDTLLISKENENTEKPASDTTPTVIGFKKWPREFFFKIPDGKTTLPYNEQQILEMLPKIMEDESATKKHAPTVSWDSLPKTVDEFEMSCEILKCPITSCQYPICNFDATRHLVHAHENISIELIPRHNIGDFKINTVFKKKDEVRCLLRILLPGVIKNLGGTKNKDCLPLYLLCARVNVVEAEQDLKPNTNTETCTITDLYEDCDDNDPIIPWKNNDCMILWCAGIVPLDFSLSVAISVFPHEDALMNLGALVKVFSLHLPQSGNEIYRTTERLMITKSDLMRLTKNSTEFDGQISIM